MEVVKTLEDKTTVLNHRTNERRAIIKNADAILSSSSIDSVPRGCGFCASIRRIFSTKTSAHRVAMELQEVSAVSRESRIFGTRQASPVQKLAEASDLLSRRVETMEKRSEHHRQQATTFMKQKDKKSALRELKKAKSCEMQAENSRGVLDAVAAHSDMLEETELQKQIAKALGSSAKTMKKDKKLLSKAEDAVENASELRDLHADLSSVMAGLNEAVTQELDENELLNELSQLVDAQEESKPTPTPVSLALPKAPNRRVAVGDEAKESLLSLRV